MDSVQLSSESYVTFPQAVLDCNTIMKKNQSYRLLEKGDVGPLLQARESMTLLGQSRERRGYRDDGRNQYEPRADNQREDLGDYLVCGQYGPAANEKVSYSVEHRSNNEQLRVVEYSG